MKGQNVELKIKIKNLADEARTIRTEERKVRGMDRWSLQQHRKTVVRSAARCSQIAYQVIRGRDWMSCSSQNQYTRIKDWGRVVVMVKKYGSVETVESLPTLEGRFKALTLSGGYNEENTRNHSAGRKQFHVAISKSGCRVV